MEKKKDKKINKVKRKAPLPKAMSNAGDSSAFFYADGYQ